MLNTLLSKKDFFDSFFNSSLDIVAKTWLQLMNWKFWMEVNVSCGFVVSDHLCPINTI